MNKEQEITLLYQLIEKHFGSGVLMQFEDLTETDNDQLLNRIEIMRVYSTYQEAKIANPSEDIIMYGNMYQSSDTPCKPSEWWKKCNPADHCMTVEKFLADGYKFVEGDIIYDGINTKNITNVIIDAMNFKTSVDSKIYILRAAALETKEPKRTKVEYARINPDDVGGKYWEVVKEWSESDCSNIHYSHDGSFFAVSSNQVLLDEYCGGNLFRRIETPIEWWEDANDLLGELANLSLDDDGVLQLTMEKGQVGFGMSRDKWCDFARILLEQGE